MTAVQEAMKYIDGEPMLKPGENYEHPTVHHAQVLREALALAVGLLLPDVFGNGYFPRPEEGVHELPDFRLWQETERAQLALVFWDDGAPHPWLKAHYAACLAEQARRKAGRT